MEEAEMAALALVALGFLSVDEEGRVWRHREMTRGSAIGGREITISPRRADTGRAKGYLRIQFTIGRMRFRCYAHRIVWMVANRRMIQEAMEVNHKNGIKNQNRPSNLELATKPHNAAHALHALGHLQQRKHPGAKLTPEQVLEIDRLCQAKAMSKAAIAAHFGVTTKTVRNIATRAKWQELFRS